LGQHTYFRMGIKPATCFNGPGLIPNLTPHDQIITHKEC